MFHNHKLQLVLILSLFGTNTLLSYTGLFEMIVGVLTTCHTQYTWDRNICLSLINRTTLQVLLHTLQLLYMCTLCCSTNINTIIEFVPNCLLHVSGDVFNGGSDSYLQVRVTCGKNEEHKYDSWRNPIERNHMGLHLENEVAVVKTPTIISNNPVLSNFIPSWEGDIVIHSTLLANPGLKAWPCGNAKRTAMP